MKKARRYFLRNEASGQGKHTPAGTKGDGADGRFGPTNAVGSARGWQDRRADVFNRRLEAHPSAA